MLSHSGGKRLLSVQMLRCASCIMVFLVHWGQQVCLEGIPRRITNLGTHGPSLFFIISGFLAARSLCGKEFRPLAYYKKRTLTILPLYYAVILWLFVSDTLLAHLGYLEIPTDEYHLGWWRYILLLNGVLDTSNRYWSNLAATWTIPVFVFFYLIAPIVLHFINGLRKAIAAWCIVTLACFLLNYFFLRPCDYHCTVADELHVFFIGVCLHWCDVRKANVRAALFFTILTILLVAIGHGGYAYLTLFALMTLLSLELESQFALGRRSRLCIDYIDAHSYALYLMHGIVIYSFIRRIMKGIPCWETGIITILGALGATWIGHNLVEVPIKRLLTAKQKAS